MGKIRVLHVLNSLGAGGIETFLMNVYRNIDKEVIQFDFLIQSQGNQFYEKEIELLGGQIFRVSSRKDGFFKNIRDVKVFFKKKSKDYNSVHFHLSSFSDSTALYFAKYYGIKQRIIHSHNVQAGGAIYHKYLHLLIRPLAMYFGTDFFACSLDAGKWMFNESIIKGEKFQVVNNAIDLKKFEFTLASRNKVRNDLNISDDCILFGNIARFHPQKNHEFLIELFSFYNKEIDSNSKLVLIGTGALKERMEEKVKYLNIEDKVLFLGVRNDVYNLISALDCFVFPSLYEGLGIVLIEAQCNGIPVVASSDVIPEEVKINKNFNFTSLHDSKGIWSESINEVLKCGRLYGEEFKENFKKSGYDLLDLCAFLNNFYLK